MAASDDDVIRKRLLIEGDGGSDDRRITALIRNYIKYCNNTDKDEDSNLYHNIMAALAQCEMAMQKATNVYNMNLEEQENYTKLTTDIEDQIKDGSEQIASCKLELEQAKQIRKNKQEYDALAKIIQQHPDRQYTTKQLQKLDSELETFQTSKNELNEKLELRKKQCHALVVAIHDMQSMMEDDLKTESTSQPATTEETPMETT